MRLAFLLLLAFAPSALAQQLPHTEPCRSELDARLAFGLCEDGTFDFYASGSYSQDVPRPDSVFGYPMGSWHTTYGRMERYLDRLAEAAPERVRVFDYGRSIEQQTMHLVAISSEGVIGRLDSVRAGLERLANPRRTSAQGADSVIAGLPVVVWLNAANDGNETAAFEAAIQLAYQLAAGDDERTRTMRDSALVLINLAHNPESHERQVAWYNGFVMGDADPAALEHDAPWGMGTNNNHYQIDLNRDGLGLTQTESRAVAYELQRWRPQIFVDLHGETTQYFFPPPALPVSPVYPEQYTRWLDTIGEGNAEAFDDYGWSYYVRDVFDLFYPGYWDTYPSLHGATGMTYETDGGGRKGVRWRRDDGTILTFADGIAHHVVASLATVETAARNRSARLRDFYAFFRSALYEGGQSPIQSVLLLPGDDARTSARLATTLLRHGIEVERTSAPDTVIAHDYVGGDAERRDVPAGAYVVHFAQPNYRLARTLLAPEIPIPAEFEQQELARLARNLRRAEGEQEGYTFYDVTAWSLPLAMGVRAYWTEERADVSAEPLTLSEEEAKAPGGWQTDVALPVEGGASERAQSAYVWTAGSTGATRLLARLLDEGFNVAVAERPLVVEGEDLPRGTFIARVGRNDEALHERIDALAEEAGVRVRAAQTAFPERGPTGTGSESTRSLRAPRVAVVAGEGVSVTSYGALWFFLERHIGQPFTALRPETLEDVRLDAFDVVILPNGRYGMLDGRPMEALKGWVERGGALIGYGGGAAFLQDQDIADYAAPDTARTSADSLAALTSRIDALVDDGGTLPVASPEARASPKLAVPGAFLRTRFDLTHWLTYGYETPDVPLLTDTLPLRRSTGGANPVVYAEENLVVSGFGWPELTAPTYAGQAYATVDRVGDGTVVLLSEDPVFRTVFDSASRLLTNALFLGARTRRGGAAY